MYEIQKEKLSIFNFLIPESIKRQLSKVEILKLLFRSLRGCSVYYVETDKNLIAYMFLKKNYLNTYAFMERNSVIINPIFTTPNYP